MSLIAAFRKWLEKQFHCPHDRRGVWFRGDDGLDYEPCLDCGAYLVSKVQLGECRTPPWGEQVGLNRTAVDDLMTQLERER